MFGHDGIPLRCTWPLWLRGAAAWLAFVLLFVPSGWGQLAAVIALVAQSESLARLHARFGGAPLPLRLRWAPLAIFLLAPIVVASFARRRVAWRGNSYELHGTGIAEAARGVKP